MKNTFLQAVIGGIAATIVMTLLMMITGAMGMPKMNPPQMLADTMGFGIIIGWVVHFMIGIIFAILYAYVFLSMLSKINNTFLRGLIFGVIAFVIAQIGMQIMGAMMPNMPMSSGDMMMMAIGSLVGHIVFGIVVAYFVKTALSK
ncbi:MAG: DUF6789 family protein [Flavobacteriaceae bacterium]